MTDHPIQHFVTLVIVLASAATTAATATSNEDASDHDGRFLAVRWSPDRRVRVNSPDTSTGPYRERSEAAATGALTIPSDLGPERLAGVALYLELWGGHPGTAEKAVRVNDRREYDVPEVGTAAMNCTYHYPLIELEPGDLVRGANAFQFSCEKGESFWGHYIIDNAALLLKLPADHPAVRSAGLDVFRAGVRAEPAVAEERIALALDVPQEHRDAIAAVDYIGRYAGYDEDGDGDRDDWHGFTKAREPRAHLGTATNPPFGLDWDVSMVPDQTGMAALAVVRFRDRDDLVYVTPATGGLETPERPGRTVTYHPSEDLPRPFWSRDGEPKTCTIRLDRDPSTLEAAELHVTIWDGGRGTVDDPFTINGHPLPVAGEGRHDLLDRVVELDPAVLRAGVNEVRVLSDTEHHGIEVLLPGPALVVRSRDGDGR